MPRKHDLPDSSVWFQQDGTPPHYFKSVLYNVDEIYAHRWIGGRMTTEWPARYSCPTPLDFL